MRPTGDGALDAALGRVSALRRLQRSAPTTGEGLVARALGDRERLRTALRSEGYWGGVPVVTLAGEPPETPGLAARLEGRPEPVAAVVGAEPGARYAIGSVEIAPEVPEADITEAGEVTGLDPGDPARAGAVIAAGERLLERMREAGRPFAAVARRDVVVDHDARTMEVSYVLAPGPRATFAPPVVEGATRVDPRLLRAVAGQLDGRRYSPTQLDRVRRDLLALGVFGTARARAAERLDAAGRLPVTFLVAERPFRALGVTAAFETAYGPTVRTYWEHRNLFGAAERLRIEGEVGRVGAAGGGGRGGGSLSSANARLSAELRQPWIGGRNVTLVSSVAALRERLRAYDRDAVTASVAVETQPDPRLTLGLGVLADVGRVRESDEEGFRDAQVAGFLGTARWDGTDNVLDPARGLRGNALVSPLYALSASTVFTRVRLGGSAYFDLDGERGSVLALRAVVGSIPGGSVRDTPPQYRFYAGGGGSVRGYDFQRIGPRRPDGTPRGGLSLVEGSVELRQRVSGAWGVAVFADAGTVGTDEAPSVERVRVGAGLGVRYATAIGPIRADVAVPLVRERDSSAFGLYVGIGQAF